MVIDRMCVLVEPAMRRRDTQSAEHAFEILEEETELLMRDPTGAGFDLPAWLVALEEQVDRVRQAAPHTADRSQLDSILPPRPLSWEDIRRQLDDW